MKKDLAIQPQKKRIIYIVGIVAFLLMIPLVAMQFTSEVQWTLSDFVIAGTLLLGAGLTFEFISRKAKTVHYRVAVGIAVFTALFLIWANLAVGIIGNEDNPANMMYFGIHVILLLGSLLTRFEPHGMAIVLVIAALAQISVGIISLIAGMGFSPMIDAFFAMFWVASAILFLRADEMSKN